MENANKKRRVEESATGRPFVCHPQFQEDNRATPANGRPKVYRQPFSAFNAMQRAAARQLLGVADEKGWESALPKKYGDKVSVFQTKTWNQLSKEHQTLASDQLDLDKDFWDGSLAPFHDSLWAIPGITLSHEELKPVLATVKKTANSQRLTTDKLACFLLSLEKVILPSQGKLIVETLKESLFCWPGKSTHFVLAAFLTFPERLFHMKLSQLLPFWSDDRDGCFWTCFAKANALKPYREALNEIPVRRTVASILAGKLPQRVLDSIKLPSLPKPIVQTILNEFLGTSAKEIDPSRIAWVADTACWTTLDDESGMSSLTSTSSYCESLEDEISIQPMAN